MPTKRDTTELDIPLEITKLRTRWELASLLNFLSIFEQVIGDDDLNMSAEEIEAALVSPSASLSKLHVTLLKGIPPVNKNLSDPNVWVTVLCKKLAEWWPWVAEGDLPLTAAKGEEISRYAELDPITRLLMLKALCEVRLEQDDIIGHISDSQKEGQISRFRKDKIAENGTGVSYWYDGNSVIGYRLYKEVKKSHSKSRHKRKGCSNQPPDIEWETLATNLDEFHKVLEQLSSSKAGFEKVVYKFIETEVIPVLVKLQKKKERALKRKQWQEALQNGHRPYAVRSCRERKPVNYTSSEFDQAITEALKITTQRKDLKVENSNGEQHDGRKRQKGNSDRESDKDDQSRDGSSALVDEDMENEHDSEGSASDEDVQNNKKGEDSDNDEDVENEQNDSVVESSNDVNKTRRNHVKLSLEKNGRVGHHLQAKNRLRQRLTRNTAIESYVVADSESDRSS